MFRAIGKQYCFVRILVLYRCLECHNLLLASNIVIKGFLIKVHLEHHTIQ